MSGSVLDELAQPLRDAVAAVGGDGAPVQLDRPADPSLGDYGSAVALSLAKPLSAAPRGFSGPCILSLTHLDACLSALKKQEVLKG